MASTKDRVGRLFAQLTGELEDASGLAVEGQNSKSTFALRRSLTRRIRRQLIGSLRTLALLDAALSPERERRP